ncbi:MAG: hypothetical protein KDD44_03905, partial [Bdellovibrionales bacterium]|nr:hypothetical protein [Bdellovibrionales bacterium]
RRVVRFADGTAAKGRLFGEIMVGARESTATEEDSLGLRFKVHVPQVPADGLRRLVLLVHGRAGSRDSMWTFARLFRDKHPVIVAPEAWMDDRVGGKSWWLIRDAASGEPQTLAELRRGSPRVPLTEAEIVPAIDRLNRFIHGLPALFEVDLQHVYIAGFSQGAALSSSYALQHPAAFRAVMMLAGFLPRAAYERARRELAAGTRLPPVAMIHGTNDPLVKVDHAMWGRDRLQELGANVSWHADPVGHKVGAEGMRFLGRWVNEHW